MNERKLTTTLNIPQMILDLLFMALAFLASNYVYYLIQKVNILQQQIVLLPVFSLVFVMAMLLYNMYDMTMLIDNKRLLTRTLISTLVAGLCMSMIVFLLKLDTTSRLLFIVFCAASYLFVIFERILIRYIFPHSFHAVKVVFIGNMEAFREYCRYLNQTAMKYEFRGVFSHETGMEEELGRFEMFIIANEIDEVVLVGGQDGAFDYRPYLQICDAMGITVRLLLDFCEPKGIKCYIGSMGRYPVVTFHSVPQNQVGIFFKSIIDKALSLIALVVLSPVFLVTAIAVKATSPGPVFFRQKRVGKNGKAFYIYKFRSMYADAEERKKDLLAQNKMKDDLMFKMDDDPRVTRVGNFIRRTSIDELPQFINVLKGDMSLVGPRPPTFDEVSHYKRWHRRRISIKPGITGMWQVSGRSNIVDFDKVVELDELYIDKWSLSLDFRLLLKTVKIVLSGKGAS